MEKITCKKFKEILTENTSVFMGSVFRWNDEKCSKAMENIGKIEENAERRTVAENHATYILFSNGSRLGFDQDGKFDYIIHENQNGIKFVIKRTTRHDDFDDTDYQDYMVYAIIQAEASAERTFHSVEISGDTEKTTLCKWLRANGYYYETSGNFDGYHIEIRCSKREAEIINRKLDKITA